MGKIGPRRMDDTLKRKIEALDARAARIVYRALERKVVERNEEIKRLWNQQKRDLECMVTIKNKLRPKLHEAK